MGQIIFLETDGSVNKSKSKPVNNTNSIKSWIGSDLIECTWVHIDNEKGFAYFNGKSTYKDSINRIATDCREAFKASNADEIRGRVVILTGSAIPGNRPVLNKLLYFITFPQFSMGKFISDLKSKAIFSRKE